MATIPAYCPHCGAVFGITNLIGGDGNVGSIIITNMTVVCPSCRLNAGPLPGIFGMENGTIVLREGPSFTRAVMERLRSEMTALSKDIETGATTPAEALELLQPLFPQPIRDFVERLPAGSKTAALVFALIFIAVNAGLDLAKKGIDVATAGMELAEKLAGDNAQEPDRVKQGVHNDVERKKR